MSEESKSVYTSYIELLRISLDAAQRIGCDMELHHGGLIKLFKEIDALQTRIAELEAERDQLTAHDATERQDDKWIPVSEQPKETGEHITLKQKEGKRFVDTAGYTKNNDYWWSDHHVTHWMPFPDPPEDTSHEPA